MLVFVSCLYAADGVPCVPVCVPLVSINNRVCQQHRQTLPPPSNTTGAGRVCSCALCFWEVYCFSSPECIQGCCKRSRVEWVDFLVVPRARFSEMPKDEYVIVCESWPRDRLLHGLVTGVTSCELD